MCSNPNVKDKRVNGFGKIKILHSVDVVPLRRSSFWDFYF